MKHALYLQATMAGSLATVLLTSKILQQQFWIWSQPVLPLLFPLFPLLSLSERQVFLCLYVFNFICLTVFIHFKAQVIILSNAQLNIIILLIKLFKESDMNTLVDR